MTYNFKYNLQKVKMLYLKDDFFYQKNNHLYKNEEVIIPDLPNSHLAFNTLGNNTYIFSHPILFNQNGKKIKEMLAPNSLSKYFGDDSFIISEMDISSEYRRAYMLYVNNVLCIKTPFKEHFLLKKISTKEKLFCLEKSNTIISCYTNLNNNKTLWQLNLSEHFDTTEVVAVYMGRVYVANNKLFLFAYSTNWKVYATLVLDSQTGKVLYQTEDEIGPLYEYNNNIYSQTKYGLSTLNCETLNQSEINLEGYLKAGKIEIVEKPMFFYNNQAFISVKKEGSDINSIWLVLDLNTKTIVHQEEVLQDFNKKSEDKNRTFIEDIQVNDHLLAVNTTGGVLYVYKKENKAL